MFPGPSQLLFKNTYPAEQAALATIKSGVLGAAIEAGWSGDPLGRLELVLEEGAVNIIRHAYPHQAHQIEVSLFAVEERLLLIIEDSGIPFDPVAFARPDLEALAEERPVGGLGIHLMKSMAEKMDYRREGDRNILEILLNRKACLDERQIS